MELNEVLLKRRSVRKFTEEPVSEEDVLKLLHAGMSGPSACNKTPWEFFVVTNPEILEKLRKAARFSKITAPLAIVVCGNLSKALPSQLSPFWIQDCSAATENILLRATDLGLGAVWCGVHPMKTAEKNVREALSLPEKLVPLNIIHIGHPSENPEPRDQFSEKKIHFIK
ncbi:MAG: nitroreductase family protein [Oscillospiraceae bacterium]|nr:nitroreductase family protein [Oscillospiraceae bacterium]